MPDKKEKEAVAFAENQPLIIAAAKHVFEGSRSLNEIETEALQSAFESSLKSEPTFSNWR